MRISPKLLVVLVCLAGAFGLLGTPAAQAAKPCWQTLLNDYIVDGTIDHAYRLHCYDDALRHLQPDVKIYGTAIDDIRDAKNNALLAMKRRGEGPIGPNTLIPPPGGGGDGTNGPKSGGSSSRSSGGEDDPGPVIKTVKSLGPKDATTLPVPLIVLGSLGLLLLAAAAVSILTRRVLARRGPTQPAPVTVAEPRK